MGTLFRNGSWGTRAVHICEFSRAAWARVPTTMARVIVW
jgi:hypothetical protein